MSKTLVVSYTPRDGSNTAKLVDSFKAAAANKTEIVERRLDESSVPTIDKDVMSTWWGPKTQNQAEELSTEFIAELKSADYVVVATPMYNWSLPAALKAWFDLVIRGGETFQFGEEGPEGLLKKTQKAALLVTTGMTAIEGEADHLTPVLKTGFGLMGVADVEVVGAQELMIIGEDEAVSRITRAVDEAAALATRWHQSI